MARDPFADPFASPVEQALGGDDLAMTFEPFDSNEEPPPLPKPKPKSKDTKTAGDVVPLPFPRSPMPAGTIPYSTHGYENADPDAIARGVMGGKVKILKPTPGKEGELAPRTQFAANVVKPPGQIIQDVITDAPVMQIDPLMGGVHAAGPGLIGQRLPSGARAKAPAAERQVDIETMKATPQTRTQIKEGTQPYFRRAVDLAKGYSTTPQQWGVLDSETFAAAYITQMKNNLLWLHDQYQWRDRASQWYDGGNKLTREAAQKYQLSNEATAGVYAALSPQKDWFENVALGDRVLETVMSPQIRATQMTPQMQATFERLTAADPKTGKAGNPELARVFPLIAGKNYDQIRALQMPDDEKALLQAAWVRLYDQAHRPQTFNTITPEGQVGGVAVNDDGTPSTLRWQTLKMTSNAIRMIETNGRDAETILGGKHKVRNFYNNLFDPSDPSSVTIDTHAVAAALLRPFGGSDLEVAHNFANTPPKGFEYAPESDITGMRGTYGLFAEAYRQAAAERGILPRQMQSITWEASRGLFTNKSPKQKRIIEEIWKRYRRGQATIEQARDAVLNASGGIDAPSWAGGSAPSANATPGSAANAGELPGAELPGPGAGGAVGGGGARAARGNPAATGVTPEGAAALGAGAY
jgi:hypothetical protein